MCWKRGLSYVFFLLGIFFLLQDKAAITGAFIGQPLLPSSFLGVFFILIALIVNRSAAEEGGLEQEIAAHEKKIILRSAIKKDPGMRRSAEDATANQRVKREIDHLVYELSRGHLAGLPTHHVEGTNIFYLRGRNGGRLYYQKISDTSDGITYEIVGKSAKGRNQDQVMNRLREKYKH